jgi:hypothetical protein
VKGTILEDTEVLVEAHILGLEVEGMSERDFDPHRSVGARCLREMDSAELGHVFAGAVALKRFLAARGKTFADLAECIEGWAHYEAASGEA